MTDFSDALENRILEAVLRATVWTAVPGVRMSLHTADPGDTGASEAAGGSYARQTPSYGGAVAGVCTQTGTVTFASMPATTITHWGLWSSDTVPVFLFRGTLSAPATLVAGDSFVMSGSTVTLL